MIKILFVEENPDMAKSLLDLVSIHGYEMSIVKSNAEVWMEYKLKRPDVVFLQAYSKGHSGCSLLHTIREKDQKVLIIVLGRSAIPFEVTSILLKGANNYLNGDYTPEIILAYLIALIRTAGREQEFNAVYTLTEDMYLDITGYCLYCGNNKIVLNNKECVLLKKLILNKRKVVDKETLILEVWPDVTVDTITYLAKVIMTLRRILAKKASVSIETVRGKGYMLMIHD